MVVAVGVVRWYFAWFSFFTARMPPLPGRALNGYQAATIISLYKNVELPKNQAVC